MKKRKDKINSKALRSLPAVDALLIRPELKEQIDSWGPELIKFSIRKAVAKRREKILQKDQKPHTEDILQQVQKEVDTIARRSIKPMVNASGILLHTNLGRAPLGKAIWRELEAVISGYSNLELDLKTGKRGKRKVHVLDLIKYLSQAEDACIVNNNAAAVLLSLKTFAEGMEVIVSRGELIEIGGSFRLPDIIAAGGAKMVEVGTTNRTRLSDYEQAINENTKVIFKAHQSNFFIGGFSEAVEVKQLAGLAEKYNLILIHDLGSGLLSNPGGLIPSSEPEVRSSLSAGAHLVTFSCDKLVGGPQAGIIAGKKKLIREMEKRPLMRVLRVGKMTIATLEIILRSYLQEERLLQNIPVFKLLNRSKAERREMAQSLLQALQTNGLSANLINSSAYCGGGALPGQTFESFGVKLLSLKKEKGWAEQIYKRLLQQENPVLGILSERALYFDVFALFNADIPLIVKSLKAIM